MPRFISFAIKEFQQLIRDREALALLFLMPTLFILIMSLALQSGFEDRKAVKLDYFFVDHANSTLSAELMRLLDEPGNFRRLDNFHAGKVSQLYELRFLRMLRFQFLQCLIQGQQIVRWSRS